MIDLINSVADHWVKYFGFTVMQNTIFLAIVFFILAKFKKLPAQIKYYISFTALLKLLVPPFVPVYFQNFIKSEVIPDIAVEPMAITSGPTTLSPVFSTPGKLFILWLVLAVFYLLAVAVITLYYQFRINRSVKKEIASVQYPKIKICETDFVSTPMSLGILPRKIYIPKNWHKLPKECYDIMLHHEYAHIKNRDGIIQLLQNFIQAIYFFHPFVWLLNRTINQYREMVCDDYAIEGSQITPVTFSRYLVHIAETISLNRWNTISASALIKQKNLLLDRINYQVKEQSMKNYSKLKTGFLIFTLVLMMVPLSLYSRVAVGLAPAEPLSLAATGKIHGKVVDFDTSKPISGVLVELKGSEKKVQTDDEGYYSIIGVEEGEFIATFVKEGYHTIKINGVTLGNESFELNVKLSQTSKPEEIAPPPPPPVSDPNDKTARINSGPSDEVFKDFEQKPSIIGGFPELARQVKYPPEAQKNGIQGKVLLKVLIGKDGKAKQADVLESVSPDCDDAAKKALFSVDYKPAVKAGEKMEVWITIPVVFKLK
ncbi:MAG: TonB family protein [Candidatus Marinimicrobia bacterium]|nr:TonB family protein [Candidatus Neomarinimicrobiota bacterium]